jgi:XTP/dITP diphosphohydrolase
MSWVLASSNPGKLQEFQDALPRVTLVPMQQHNLHELPPETGTTYEANALIKATYACQQTGLPALADDSGLEVDALGGAPGVYSARYGREVLGDDADDGARLRYLLERLRSIPNDNQANDNQANDNQANDNQANRRARFMCVLVLAFPDDTLITSKGVCYGSIVEEPRGEGGFGYDSVFLSDDLGKTFGEASREEKSRISHRAQALQGLREWLDTDAGHAKIARWQ